MHDMGDFLAYGEDKRKLEEWKLHCYELLDRYSDCMVYLLTVEMTRDLEDEEGMKN